MVQSCQLLIPEEQNQLAEDLRCEENFSSFLLYTFKNIAEEYRSDIIFIGSFIWEVYLISAKDTCKIKFIIEKMKNIMSTNMEGLMKIVKTLAIDPNNKALLKPFTALINGLTQVSAFVI